MRAGSLSIALVTLALVTAPRSLRAWGSGHDDVMRAVIERLPAVLRDTFTPEIVKEAVHHASHYPDSFEPFLAEDLGDAALARLREAGLKVRYDLHSERGIAGGFLELVEALREKDPARTAHWIASHSHVIADMAACNHDPLVHTATYGWADWKLKLPGGADFSALKPLLDLSGTARDARGGKESFEAAIERLSLPDDDRGAAAALTEVMLYGQTGAAFCSERGVAILEGAAGWIDRGDEAAREQLWDVMGELGAWAVVRTLRDVAVASRLAASGIPPQLTPEIEAAYRSGVERLLRERRLEEEALFAPVLRELDSGDAAAIGVVLEPCWAMNGAMLGFSSRVQSAAIARTLKESGRPYATLDVREILAEGFPDPRHVPRIVVVASAFRSYHNLKAEVFDERLGDYLDRGGRIFWVAGTGAPAPKMLAAFQQAMRRDDAKSRLPVPEESFVGAVLEISGSESLSLRIAHRANTAAGWQQPFCPWTFEIDGNAALEPFATLRTGEAAHVVGAISPDRRIVCLPLYAVTPHLFDGGGPIGSPHQPALDPAAASVFFAALDALRTDAPIQSSKD